MQGLSEISRGFPKDLNCGARAMTPQLGMLAALAEDWLTPACQSSSSGVKCTLWPPQTHVHRHMQTQHPFT